MVKEARGKYALIYGESLVGVFPSLKESFVAGYSELGNVPFLVKEINEEDPIYFVG